MPWLDMKAEMEKLGACPCTPWRAKIRSLPLMPWASPSSMSCPTPTFWLCWTWPASRCMPQNGMRAAPDCGRRPLHLQLEPLAAFFDVIQLGEGERQLPAICAAIEQGKKEGISKKELLLRIAKIPGVYIRLSMM